MTLSYSQKLSTLLRGITHFECIVEKIDGCKNNHENSSATKVSELIPTGFSISTTSSFRSI